MTNLNYGEMTTCEPRDTKPETAKSVLENTDDILKELFAELRRIDDAIYSPKNVEISRIHSSTINSFYKLYAVSIRF